MRVPTGLDLRVYRGGPAGGAPPLVWLHPASGVNADDPVVAALAERFDVYAPLAPGFHEIAELDDIRDIHELAMLYDDLLEVLGLDAVACAGHSFGGMVAAELAAHHPRRVSKLVLVAPVGLWNDAYPVADIFATPPVQLADLVWGDPDSDIARAARAASGAGVTLAERVELVKDEAYVEGMVRLVMGFTAVAKFMWPLPDKGLARRCYRITRRHARPVGGEGPPGAPGVRGRLRAADPPQPGGGARRRRPHGHGRAPGRRGRPGLGPLRRGRRSLSFSGCAPRPHQAGRNVAPSAVHTAAGAGSSSYSTKMHSPGHCIDDSTTTCS